MAKCISIPVQIVDLLDSIESDLALELRAHEREDRGGFLSISRQVFCYIDYLGALAANGKNSSINAINFMEKYFTQSNPDYSKKCNLMYTMWRHGTVHEFKPKQVVNGNEKFHIYWGANNSSKSHNRKWHLKCLCIEDEPNHYKWFINLFELIDDLRSAIKHFISEIESDENYLIKVKSNFEKLPRVIDLDTNKYQSLHPEAKALIDTTAGVIDRRLQVIKEFDTRDKYKDYLKNW